MILIMIWIHRLIENELLQAVSNFPSLLLIGPRCVGEITLLLYCMAGPIKKESIKTMASDIKAISINEIKEFLT